MNNRLTIYILALAVFLIGTIEYIITGVIEMIAADLGVSTSEVGLLVTVFALSAAIIAPVLIALTINMDRKKLLLTALGVFIASNGLMLLKLPYEAMLGVRVIQGASGGIATVVAMAVATRLVERERRGNAIGIILMGLSSSLVLGVPAGTFSADTLGGGLCSSSSGAQPYSAVHHLSQGPCHKRKRSRHPEDAALCA